MTQQSRLTLLLDALAKRYVTAKDVDLLQCVFAANPTQERLDATLQTNDIEHLGLSRALLLSYVLHDHPALVFPPNTVPRLKGLVKYFHFANIKVLAHFSAIGRALNEADIPLVLMRGAAFKSLRPKLSRPMGDVDILVHKKHMETSVQVSEALGYTASKQAHSVDMYMQDTAAVDIHHVCFVTQTNTDAFHANLFARAKPCEHFRVRFLLPCHEDLFFLTAVNMIKNMFEISSVNTLFYTFGDCKYLLQSKPDFDWSIVYENAQNTGTSFQLYLAMQFMNHIVPNIINHPPCTMDKKILEEKTNKSLFLIKYLQPLQEACRKMLVLQLKNNPKYYGKRIITFLLWKKLAKYPALVRWFLQKKDV